MKRDNAGRFIKGFHYSSKTEFKKGENVGNKHWAWMGGRSKIKTGYITCYSPGHPRACQNRVYEHILVAEKKIGRYLIKNETVHHINGIKEDNRPENLIVLKNNVIHRINYHSMYRRICNKPLPSPTKLGEKIYYVPQKVHYTTKQCKICGNLFWLSTTSNKKHKGFCGPRCGTLNRWRKIKCLDKKTFG